MNDDRPAATEPEVYRIPPRPVWHDEGDVISLVQVVNLHLRHRWKLLGTAAVGAGLAVIIALILPSTFTSESKLVPQTGGTGGQLGRLSGVAAQFGVDVLSSEPGQSPQFYANLLTSERLLEEAVTTRYSRSGTGSAPAASPDSSRDRSNVGLRTESDDTTGSTLVELYDIEAPNHRLAVSIAAERLMEDVSASANAETGVVDLSVTTEWPAVSAQVADRLIELVNVFNSRVRQSQASAQAQFIRQRLQHARRELRTAEDSLETFLKRNVGWQQSPELLFQQERLQRRVSLKQEVYTSLANRYEEARISEVKETPVVTVVAEPDVPAREDRRSLFAMGLIGCLVGGTLGIGWAAAVEFDRRIQERSGEDYRELAALRQEAAEDVRRFARRIGRLLPGWRSGGGS